MKIEKSEGLTVGEKEVSRLCEKSFLKLWSYPNLYKQPGKELCDNIIFFENTIILISEKTKTPFDYDHDQYKEEDFGKEYGERKIDILWNRWSKEVKKSEDQLIGAERWIKEHPEKIYLDPQCKTKFPLSVENIENIKFIKISVINGLDNVNRIREKACNGELEYELPKEMFIFTIDLSNIIHLLDDYTFPIIMNELDTSSDFINFFVKKEEMLKSGKSPFAVLDLDLLVIYLSNINYDKYSFSLGELDPDNCNADFIIIDNPSDPYIDFIKEKNYLDLKDCLRDSYLWDKLIDSCSQDILDDILHKDPGIKDAFKTLSVLSSETRLSRLELSKQYIDIIDGYKLSGSYRGRAIVSPYNKDIAYVFLQVEILDGENYEDYRTRRTQLSECYAMALNANHSQIKKVVIIASEPVKYNKSLSRDFILYECHELTSKEKAKILKMQNSLDILNGKKYTSKEKVGTTITKKINRNDKCLCGSGKKYKKCCLAKNLKWSDQ